MTPKEIKGESRPPMQTEGPTVFISYAREDLDAARTVFFRLRDVGLCPWLDTEMLLPGQKWKTEVGKAIRKCSYFIALLSERSVNKRGYAQKELKEALEILDEVPESGVFLIPARLDECRPSHDKLHELQWLDLFPDFDQGFENLLRVVCPPSAESPYLELPSIARMDFQKQPEIEVRFSKPDSAQPGVRANAIFNTASAVTSIPKPAIRQLRLRLNNRPLRLIRRPTNVYLSAYSVDLRFAGRTFRIDAVAGESAVAVLGCDVLRHSIVLYDGPSQKFKLWFTDK